MSKKTGNFLIGIGIASILAGIYAGIRSGDYFDAISGVFIGVALIGTVIIERNKKQSESNPHEIGDQTHLIDQKMIPPPIQFRNT